MIDILKNFFRLLALILLQVLVFNRIEISMFLSPMIMVLFIISAPFTNHKWLILISSFALGLSVDLFMNTPGILSFTAVAIAYIRPFVLRALQPREGYAINDRPKAVDLGWAWFSRYAVILTVLFHLLYFIILAFSQDNFLIIIWKTIISSAFTLIFIFIFQLLSFEK